MRGDYVSLFTMSDPIAIEEDNPLADQKLYSAACERNRGPILEVLQQVFPAEGRVLEIAAGTGMHAVFLAKHLPGLSWLPTDSDDEALRSIDAWRDEAGLTNLEAPRSLDTRDENWATGTVDAILCCNMIHISPWDSCRDLFRGADEVLCDTGVVVTYGPYFFPGGENAASNEVFDRSLRTRNPAWGVRSVDDVSCVARDCGFIREETIALPANNHAMVWRRA